MRIRNVEQKDREGIRAICLETASTPYLAEHKDILWLLYADYYVDEEPETCFVCVDDEDNVLGYILCAPNSVEYAKKQRETYLPALKKLSPKRAPAQRLSLAVNAILKRKYPAHMHIDLCASVRRMGYGSLLIERLFEKLRELGVCGVQLGCAADNTAAAAFYEKNGFRLLLNTRAGIIFGHELGGNKNEAAGNNLR